MAYLHKVLNPTESQIIVDHTVEAIIKSGIDFDFIAVRGMSGAILSGALSIALQKPIAFVRKEHEQSHGYEIERADGFLFSGSRYIIFDDGIASGETILTIIKKFHENDAHCVGCFLYNQVAIGGLVCVQSITRSLREKNIFAQFVIHTEKGMVYSILT